MRCVKMKFPIGSKKEYMQDKKIDYKALSIATLYSKMKPKEILYELGEDELFRYTYQNKLKDVSELRIIQKYTDFREEVQILAQRWMFTNA